MSHQRIPRLSKSSKLYIIKLLAGSCITLVISFTFFYLIKSDPKFPYLINNLVITNFQKCVYPNEINNLIDIYNEDDILHKRNKLIQYIWKQKELPNLESPVIETNIIDNRYSNLETVKQIDKLTINMTYKVNSVAYHFHALEPNNKLVIYHESHTGDFIKGYDTIKKLLSNGYDVVALSMPLLGMNNQPEIEIFEKGLVKFTSHNQFKLLDNKSFSSIKYFIEPVLVAINYAETLDYKEINMVGVSGGGWTTVLASAIDPRISKSYSIAGTYPLYLRSKQCGENIPGDYEQTDSNLYKNANYLELYVLDSYGSGRRHTQIINVYDPCCFSGRKYKSYESIVSRRMELLDEGDFTIFADDTHNKHTLSETGLDFIIRDLELQ